MGVIPLSELNYKLKKERKLTGNSGVQWPSTRQRFAGLKRSPQYINKHKKALKLRLKGKFNANFANL